MEKVMFILHMYSVGGAERRCVSIANHLASRGVKVKIVLLDMNKMYACKKNHNGLEIDIGFADYPGVNIPADEGVELVYLLHRNELPLTADKQVTCVAFDENNLPPKQAGDYIVNTDTAQKKKAKKQLIQLEELYVNRIYQYVKKHPDYKVISWMTFCNIATAVALDSLPNDFAFVECTSPDVEFPSDSGFNYLKALFYPRASAAFFQTREMRDFYTYLPKLKSFVIPNPILSKLPHHAGEKRTKNIVNFCRVEKPKNLELLIDAFSALCDQYPGYRLHIYGDGSEKEHLLSIVNQQNLQEYVTFFDFTPDVHSKVINDAMFVSTSNREGISNSMIEAMALGIPTICTDCHGGGARAIINDGENGLLVPMENKCALVAAMSKIIESPELSERLSKKGAELRTILSIANVGKMWEQAIETPWNI
jgi:glycosyltransferase involved in cell wall biosynthesis